MDRRTFLKAAGSFAFLLPWVGKKAFAQNKAPYPGPFLICINAEGGWDTTMFFDPKVGNYSKKGTRINTAYEKIATKDLFSYAPVNFECTDSYGKVFSLPNPETFLNAHGSRLLLLNGVDVETNAHPVGNQRVWSGHIATDYPSIGALLAAKASENYTLPCAYIADVGAYTKTQGIVPLSRLDASNMRSIAYENNFPRSGGSELFSPETSQRIAQAQAQRVKQLEQQLLAPRSQLALQQYDKAMLSKSGLQPLADVLPAAAVSVSLDKRIPDLRDRWGLDARLKQAELALYGFQTGTIASASISFGGFDSHSNNNPSQQASLGLLFVLIEYILEQANKMGISNLYVVVGSDFARPPYYVGTSSPGKDHWTISSYLLFGPNINPGRVLGRTTSDLEAQFVNPKNPAVLLSKDAGGIVLRPSHLHYELRNLLGLSEFNSIYGLADKGTPLNEGNRVSLF